MNTLVVHPNDRSTDFLRPIYHGIKGATLVTNGLDKNDLRAVIPNYDRVILLGHGTAEGLLSVNRFPSSGLYIIDKSFHLELRSVKDLVCIWCHADQFVNKHNLRSGFYTGMFISEMIEASGYLPGKEALFLEDEKIEESNDQFAISLGQHISRKPSLRYKKLMTHYATFSVKNPVARYNAQRLYWHNPE